MTAAMPAEEPPRTANEPSLVPQPVPPVLQASIMEIQGAGHVSPLLATSLEAWLAGEVAIEGAVVETAGVVTAVDASGFYLQDPAGDGDRRTSDAIYVEADDLREIFPGRTVTVTGSVREVLPESPTGDESFALPETQLLALEVIVSDVAPAIFPTEVEIGPGGRLPPSEITEDDGFSRFQPATDGADFFESLEGMLVHLPSAFPVGPTQDGRLAVIADPEAASGLSGRGTLVATSEDANPERILIAPDDAVFETDAIEGLDVFAFLSDVRGVLASGAEGYRLVPTSEMAVAIPDFFADPRETTRLEGDASTLTVATYAIGARETAEGAALAFSEIARDILQNLNAPDILALQGLADTPGLADLELALDAADDGELNGSSPYGSLAGADGLALLYRSDRVAPEETLPLIAAEAYPGETVPLTATFAFGAERVTFVNAAFTPHEPGAPTLGQLQPVAELLSDPRVNPGVETRLAEAEAIATALETVLAGDPDADLLLLGAFEDPAFGATISEVLAGRSGPLVDLSQGLAPTERYTAIEDGNAVARDHILTTGALAAGADVDIVHINAEFASRGLEAALRDPVVASLRLGDAAPTPIVGTQFEDALIGTPDADRIASLGSDDIVNGSAGDDEIDGGEGRDTVVYSGATFEEIAELQDTGELRVRTEETGTDTLRGVERVAFDDRLYLFDLPGEEGDIAFRLYEAAFGRDPDEAGLRFHADALAEGRSPTALAGDFAASPEFEERYGDDPSDAFFTELLYANALGRAADADGLAFWTEALSEGRLTRPEMLLAFSESPENVARTAPDLMVGILLDELL